MEIEEILTDTRVKEVIKNGGRVMVIGDTNTGKTTLCHFLLKSASERGMKKAFLDLDIGQSSFLPGTLNAYFEEKGEIAHYFVGSISPSGFIPEVLRGVGRLMEWLLERNADFVVIDTTGYINTPEAISLKGSKIKAISPDLIIVLASEDLISVIKEVILQYTRNFILATPSSKVKARGLNERRKYREALFKLYFEGATSRRIDFPKKQAVSREVFSERRFIGLIGEDELMLSAGVINSFDGEKLEILTNYLGDLKKMRCIKIGNLLVNPNTGEHQVFYSNCENSLLDMTIL